MKIIKSVFSIAVAASLFSCGNQASEVKSLETDIDSVSYAIGLTMSGQLKNGFEEVNAAVLTQAIKNGLDSTNLLLEDKDVQNIIRDYFQKKQAAKQEENLAKAEVNKQKGIEFLEANKSKEGVVTTESGLQYIVLEEGDGEKPAGPETRVKVHYHGTNIEGKVFDSSVDRGKPAEFSLNQVIKGWTEGLQLMKVGSKYKFFIPQELAYGPQNKGENIQSYSTLIFEVELLEILK
ncbi:FKBP-type peptidyl-prolyl cis-trans isomerase [Polaribacter sargassicola]|uniref:FKBP-type peptidyl-prolyl cis-trans isomerase n=1 Tax=Polaribacter sargassicola TaxID=2836891 RepID=UPI001F19B002|nr:FKBP-type peptidyl-prolyl cis-trans isomerase [Polaribacter sp. DS7-9]MCG1037605.1 FKBP-type peptidyl-prolyl cis-trans isomerase [Polaribacter sp. DS7-9]